MFYQFLNNIDPYGTSVYDKFMSSISGSEYSGDNTMVTTLRALLFERLNGTPLTYKFVIANKEWAKRKTPKTQFKYVFNEDITAENKLVLADLGNITEEEFNGLNEELSKTMDAQTDISAYLKDNGNFDVGFLTNHSNNSAFIFARNLNIRLYHLLQSFIPRYFKHLFIENQLTDIEKNLVKSLTERSNTNYNTALSLIAEQHDYRDMIVRGTVAGFEKHCRDRVLQEAIRKRDDLERQIRDILNRQREIYRRFEEEKIKVEGIRALQDKAGDSSDIADYFIANKSIDLIAANEGILEFYVRTSLDFFDVEGFESMSKNGDIYGGYNVEGVFADPANRKLIMDNLFSAEPRIAVKMCAYFSLDIRGNGSSDRRHVFSAKYSDYLPNPHLHYHNCLGGNEPQINEFLMKGEILAAVDQCVSAARGVNVHETGATFRPMLNNLFSSDKKIIRTIDGVDMTPAEAVAWLKGETE